MATTNCRETRTFNGVPYSLSYSYNLANELTGINNQWGAQVGYGYDGNGQLTNVSGANYGGVSNYASGLTYRAWGGLKSMNYGNGLTLSTAYDNRMRPTTWNVSGVLGYNYNNGPTGQVGYAQSIYDSTLDRSYEYDQLGALVFAHSGAEARAAMGIGGQQWGTSDGPYSHMYDYDQYGNMTRRFGWGGEVQGGAPYGGDTDIYYTYSNGKNQRDGFSYDAAGNLTNDGPQTYTYDATGAQATANSGSYSLQQNYDGDGLRVKKIENGATTFYLRSSVLGGQVIAEIDGNAVWQRGYVYAGGSLMAVQQGGVFWMHEDPVTKSKRTTDINGNVVSAIELDPWGADTNRSDNAAFQPRKFTTYDRDGNGSDEAMFRRYNRMNSRFDQPDPHGGSYDFSDPQSFNRYAYTRNDPVNFRDPTGLFTNEIINIGTVGEVTVVDTGGAIDAGLLSILWDLYFGGGGGPIGHGGDDLGGGSGGGGGGGVHEGPQKPSEGQKAKFDLDKFKHCIDIMYSVQLAPEDGHGRVFSTTRTAGHFIGVNEKNQVFQVDTSMTAYTSSQLRDLKGNAEPGTILGATIKGHPYLNFVASEVASNPRTSMDVIQMIQIHELGNSLAQISGYAPDAHNDELRRYDPDSGNALVECVYGGFVRPDGTITYHPGRN